MKKSLLFVTLLAFGFQSKAQESRVSPSDSSQKQPIIIQEQESLFFSNQDRFGFLKKNNEPQKFKPFYDYKLPIAETTSIDNMPMYRPDANTLVPMPNVRPNPHTHFHILNDDRNWRKPR